MRSTGHWGTAILVAAGMLMSAAAFAAGESYHLFNPTPSGQLRGLSTDRPDKTESPYTVDAGHIQAEIDLVSHASEDFGSTTVSTLGVGTMNVKLGLFENADLQFVFAPYLRATVDTGPTSFDVSGAGDVTLRMKINLIGNDGGPTGFGIMPFVTLPSGDGPFKSGTAGGGAAFPVALTAGDVGIGLMLQGAFDEFSQRVLATATAARPFSENLGGFIELAIERVSVDGGQDFLLNTLDAGLTLGITPNAQLDGAVFLGLSEDADDITAFLGFTIRS